MTEKIYSWLKLSASFTHSKEIKLIRQQKNGVELCWLWIELLCLSIDHCKEEDIGLLRFSEKIPYSPDILSDILGLDKGVIENGISLFQKAGLLEIADNGDIWIEDKYIGKMLGSKTGAAHRMEKMRERRDQKLNSVTMLHDVTKGYKKLPYIEEEVELERERDVYKEKEIECEKEEGYSFQKKPKVPYKEIVASYHRHCGDCLPEVKFINSSRKSRMKARWLNELPTLEAWDDYFKKVAFCDFLMGRKTGKNGEPFRCAFDWLICPSNLVKVLEGKYV